MRDEKCKLHIYIFVRLPGSNDDGVYKGVIPHLLKKQKKRQNPQHLFLSNPYISNSIQLSILSIRSYI